VIPLLFWLASASQDLSDSPEVEVEALEGRSWFTVHAQNASAERVLLELARASGRELELHVPLDSALLTIDLVRRPLEQVVEYALGSVGMHHEMRQDTIVVHPGTAQDVEGAFDLASAAWSRAALRFPDDPQAPVARLSQGEIAEWHGDLELARDRYLSLPRDYPKASEVAEATLRAGRISERLGQWGEASRLFRTLANLESAQEYQAIARLEWARAMIAQGESQAALQMLGVLDASHPAANPMEATARRLVRARALETRGFHMEALRELDLAEHDLDPLGRWESLEIRASALTGAGLHAEAGRAWLLYAQEARGTDRAFAYRQAAERALEAGDDLAVMFVAREATERSVEVDLSDLVRSARAGLGFADVDPGESLAERIAAAEAALEEGALDRAEPAWEALFLARGALDEETSARIGVGWTRCVAARRGLGPAIALLVEERGNLHSAEARRIVDLGAAALFEEHGRFEDAIDAYEGRYRP